MTPTVNGGIHDRSSLSSPLPPFRVKDHVVYEVKCKDSRKEVTPASCAVLQVNPLGNFQVSSGHPTGCLLTFSYRHNTGLAIFANVYGSSPEQCRCVDDVNGQSDKDDVMWS